MIRRNKILVSVLVLVCLVSVGLIGWAPWVTEEYAIARVMEHLGGPTALFNYLGEPMPVRNVPMSFKKLPFVSLVYFPGEAIFMVTFFGSVI